MNRSSVDDDQALSFAFGWLAELWLKELDQPQLESLTNIEIRDAYVSLGGYVPEPKELDELAVEYCRLFVGPGPHVSPVQSVWQENQYQGEAADSMVQYFSMLDGYDPPSEIPDHIGTQFHYLAALYSCVAEPTQKQQVLEQFAQRHLSWTGELFERLAVTAESQFYLGLVGVTKNLLSIVQTHA